MLMKKINMVEHLFSYFAKRNNCYFDIVKITAATFRYLGCMKDLISNGSNVNEKNNKGKTPLDLLFEEERLVIEEYIKKMEDEDPLLVKGVVEDF